MTNGMRSGWDAIRKAQAERESQFTDYERAEYLVWKEDGEKHILRWLLEDPVMVDTHAFVTTHQGKNMTFVCRKDKGLMATFPDEFDGTCELHDLKHPEGTIQNGKDVSGSIMYWPRQQIWCPAILRVEYTE